MSSGSKWRINLVQEIVPVYAANPKVAAILLGGSTARGQADRYSDIELGIFWHEPMTESERKQAAVSVPGDLVYLYPYDKKEEVWSDDFMLGRSGPDTERSGVLLEIAHSTTDLVDRTLTEVLEEHNPDLQKQNLIAGILQGRTLYKPELLDDWKRRAAEFPDELTLAVLRRYAQIDHFWRWQMWLDRGNNLMMLYESFTEVQQKLLHVLLALNKQYYYGFKWLNMVVSQFEKKPKRFLERMTAVYEAPPAIGAGFLAELVEDTYDLIEADYPDLDVDWLRNVFRYERPFWEDAPPYP